MRFFFLYKGKRPYATVAYETVKDSCYYGIAVLSKDDKLDVSKGIAIAGNRCRQAEYNSHDWKEYEHSKKIKTNIALERFRSLGLQKLGKLPILVFEDKIKQLL